MKNQAKITLIISLAWALLGLLVWRTGVQSAASKPRIWTVDDDNPADFHTIQEAINSADPGDTIYVYNGTYQEHLILNKPLTLLGESKESTIIDGNRTGTVIQVTAHNVTINSLTVQKSSSQPGTSYAGIKISGRMYTNLTGNHVTGNKIGIFVTSERSRIAENSVENNGQGIALYDSCEVTVRANNLTGNTVGISLALSLNNSIIGNRATDSSHGGHGIILSQDSFNNIILNNHITSNHHGLWLSGSHNNKIVNNTIANNELLGVELAGSQNNTFYHNNFINNPTQVRIDHESIGIWDHGYPSGGNHWNDYKSIDEKSGPHQDQPGSDGIWDHPYVINKKNQDNYPIVPEFSTGISMLLTVMTLTATIALLQTKNT